MLQLANMSMRSKLLLLIFLPYAVLSVFSIQSIYKNFVQVKDYSQDNELINLISKLDDLADTTIEELDITKIENSNASSAKAETDQAILAYKEQLETLDPMTTSNSIKQYNLRINEKLGLLNQKRNLDQSQKSDKEQYYYGLVNDILDEIGSIARNDVNPEISNMLFPYIWISHASLAGIEEKNILSEVFKTNKFDLVNLKRLLISINSQNNFETAFLEQSSNDQKDAFKTMQKSQPYFESLKMRNAALDKISEGNFGIDSTYWIQAQSSKLTLMKDTKNKILEMVKTRNAQIVSAAERNLFLISTVFLLVTAATILLTYLIVKNITQPLKVAVDLAEDVSEGNLQKTSISSGRLDEMGMLEKAICKMGENLQKMTRKLQEEVLVLTSSASEIVTSIAEVSSATAETATAVTETTTTVEELKQTAQISAEKAKDVVTSAEGALNTLKNSEKSLNSTIEDMHHIQERMVTISESIVKLSEHSQSISEIIDTVNDLAEQSNLLAVNAAIEAAKAGDQGKGFAVVAQEVRSLAEQSKQATVQVHNILKDIQNSTSSAVMATEQGSKAVTKGVNQSSETNEAIRSLSKDISKVSQTATQIAVSSQQQLVGVDQVTVAMTNIKEASNQHVDHMHQIEKTVHDLNAVGQTLKGFVDQYKL